MADARPLPDLLKTRDSARRRRYADALAFYRGNQWAVPRTPFARQGGTRQLTLNYARAIIDKTASYTIAGLTWAATPLDKTQPAITAAATAEAAMEQVAEQNALDALDLRNEVDCSVLGDAAYKVTWDDTALPQPRVRVTAPDITTLWAWRRPDDINEIWRVAQRYTLDADDARDLYGITARTRTPEIVEEWTATTLRTWVEGALQSEAPNPYGFIPYVIYANVLDPAQEWGTSDIVQLRDAAIEVNRITSQLSQIAELSGNPIAVLAGITDATDIAVQPGAVWELPAETKAYLLDLLSGGGARILIDFAESVRTTLHDLSETPRSAFGENPGGLSGVALKISLDPLVKKVARKRIIRARALTQRNAMALALLAANDELDAAAAALPVRPVWPDVNPADRSRDIADNVAMVNAGIESRHTAATELGTQDPDEELTRWLDESARISAVQAKQTSVPPIR